MYATSNTQQWPRQGTGAAVDYGHNKPVRLADVATPAVGGSLSNRSIRYTGCPGESRTPLARGTSRLLNPRQEHPCRDNFPPPVPVLAESHGSRLVPGPRACDEASASTKAECGPIGRIATRAAGGSFDGRQPVAARLKGTLKRNARPTVTLLSASGASRHNGCWVDTTRGFEPAVRATSPQSHHALTPAREPSRGPLARTCRPGGPGVNLSAWQAVAMPPRRCTVEHPRACTPAWISTAPRSTYLLAAGATPAPTGRIGSGTVQPGCAVTASTTFAAASIRRAANRCALRAGASTATCCIPFGPAGFVALVRPPMAPSAMKGVWVGNFLTYEHRHNYMRRRY